MSPIWNTSSLLRFHAGTIHKSNLEPLHVCNAPPPCFYGSTKGQSMSPIWNTSSLLRFHAGMIHESNLEHLLVSNAPPRDNPRVQWGKPSRSEGSTRWQSTSPIRNTRTDRRTDRRTFIESIGPVGRCFENRKGNGHQTNRHTVTDRQTVIKYTTTYFP